MSSFPVIHSILSPEHLATWVGEMYGLTNVSCRLIRANMNDTYLVETGGDKYVLRIYTYGFRTRQDVSEEIRLLSLLRANDINVSYPIPDKAGELIHELDAPEGGRMAVLFSYAAGDKIRFLTEEFNSSIGTLMGSFHHVTFEKTIERREHTIRNMAEWGWQQARKYFSEGLEEMKFIKACIPLLEEAFQSVPELRKGIVHLDIWYDNMSVLNDGTITLFDLDNAGNGWLVLDVGYYCMQRFYTEPDAQEYERKTTAFINAYRKVAPLPDEELKLVPYAGLAIWIYYLGVQCERFDKISNFFLSENYLKMFIDKAKKWMEYQGVRIEVV